MISTSPQCDGERERNRERIHHHTPVQTTPAISQSSWNSRKTRHIDHLQSTICIRNDCQKASPDSHLASQRTSKVGSAQSTEKELQACNNARTTAYRMSQAHFAVFVESTFAVVLVHRRGSGSPCSWNKINQNSNIRETTFCGPISKNNEERTRSFAFPRWVALWSVTIEFQDQKELFEITFS